MRSSLLALGWLMVVFNGFGQVQTDWAKYELIRETINFLAADQMVSRDTTFRISCETMDYECFRHQLSDNPITGIDHWYSRWQSIPVTGDADLKTLRNRIFSDIFDRPGKGYRKQLAGYDDYIQRVTDLIDRRLSDAGPADGDTLEAAMALASIPIGPQPIYPEQSNNENDNPANENIMIAYLAIVIGLIALVMAALPFIRRNKARSTQLTGPDQLRVHLDEIALRVKQLERKTNHAQTADAITHLTEIMEAVEKRVVELEEHALRQKKPDNRAMDA